LKKQVLKYGAIVGGINSLGLVSLIFFGQTNLDYSEAIGYSLMLVAFSFIYLGVKSYRDDTLKGQITFGKGLQMGLLITLVASVVYVLTWIIVYYGFIPDFMDKYVAASLEKVKKNGANEIDLAQKMQELEQMKEIYKNPLFMLLITFSEILPMGILASLIVSLVVRRKTKSAS
jgi:ethanolamine transporter EutH